MAIKLNKDDGEDIMADINVTPLIDIMLVLLIIFMVSSSISLNSGLDIKVPQTSSNTKSSESDVVIISLDSDGVMAIQGEKTSAERVKEVLSDAIQQSTSKTVILEGDSAATLGRTVEIMDLAKEMGALKFSIAATQKSATN